MPNDRGAEQGDVDGPLECGLAQEWRQQKREEAEPCSMRRAPLPWIGANDPAQVHRLQADRAARLQESTNFQLGGPEKLAEKRRLGGSMVHG